MYLARLFERLAGGASGRVFRGMAVLLAGSTIGRVIGLAAMPLLTRIYGPEDFGVLAVFTALVLILAPLATLRYALALPLPRHDGTAMNLMVLSIGLLAGSSALIGLTLWTFGPALLGLISMEMLAPWWWLVALGVLTTALYELLTFWATRQRAYRIIAITNVWQSAAGALVMVGLGLLAMKPGGLLLGRVVSQSGGIGSLLRGFAAALRQNLRHVRLSRIWRAAWRYRGFPAWRMPSQFLMAFSMQAPIMVSTLFFTSEEIGQLSIALLLIVLPSNLFSQNLSKAHYAEATRLKNNPSELLNITKSVFFKVILVSIIPTILIFLLSPKIIPLFLGKNWAYAGTLTSVLSLSLIAQMASQSIINTLSIIDKNIIFFRFNAMRAILTISALSVPPLLGYDMLITIAIYTAAISIQRIYQSYTVFMILNIHKKHAGVES